MPALDWHFIMTPADGDSMKRNLIISRYHPASDYRKVALLKSKYFKFIKSEAVKGFYGNEFPEKCPNISLHYPTFAPIVRRKSMCV